MSEKEQKQSTVFWGMVKRHFLTGIATIFPLFITIYIIVAIIRFTDGVVGNSMNEVLDNQYGFKIPGLGIIIMLLIIFGAGFMYNHFFGRKLFSSFSRVFNKIPVVSNIYPSAKQLSDFMFKADKKENFQKVVLVQFPENGTYSIGFITNKKIDVLTKGTDQELTSVFIPLAPVPFSGHILLVPRERFREINISIDEAIKFVVSGGVVINGTGKTD